jgi:hypothetical protein
LSAEFGYANSNNVKYKYLDFFFPKGRSWNLNFQFLLLQKVGNVSGKKIGKEGKISLKSHTKL